MKSLYISEIFGPTIQGEGLFAGRLSLFIRFGLCNFKCKGFGVEYYANNKLQLGCDSYYSVDTAFKQKWQKLTANEIISKLNKLGLNRKIDIVITGGEPLLYWKNTEFQKLLKFFYKNNNFVTIETNGSIVIDISKKYQKSILFSIGLKLENSKEKKEKRVNKTAIKRLIKSNKSYFKFVISSKKDIQQIKEIIQDFDIPTYLMPLGATKQELDLKSKKVAKWAIKYGFNYSDRIHIRLWGDKRGV